MCVFTGADLSDYFNYGFNEDTWKAYCEKQKRLRMGLEVSSVSSVTSKITVRPIIIVRLILILYQFLPVRQFGMCVRQSVWSVSIIFQKNDTKAKYG